MPGFAALFAGGLQRVRYWTFLLSRFPLFQMLLTTRPKRFVFGPHRFLVVTVAWYSRQEYRARLKYILPVERGTRQARSILRLGTSQPPASLLAASGRGAEKLT